MKEAPERRLETLARQWNPRAINALSDLKQAGEQRDFQREQNQVNFDQSKEIYGMQKQDQAARDAEQRQQRMEDFTRGEEARKQEQAERRNWDLTLHGMGVSEQAMRDDREMKQKEAERTRMPMVGTIPVPGTDYVIPTADGRAMGTLPSKQPDAKPPAGLVPQAADINGVRYGPPSTKVDKPHIEMMKQPDGSSVPYSVHVDAQGQVVMRKVKIIDANKDGIDDRMQGGGGTAAPSAEKPSSFLNF